MSTENTESLHLKTGGMGLTRQRGSNCIMGNVGLPLMLLDKALFPHNIFP